MKYLFLWVDLSQVTPLRIYCKELYSERFTAANLTQVALDVVWNVPSDFTASQWLKPIEVPQVSFGTLWSNEIDTFWLYGGQNLENNASNTIWRYDMKAGLSQGTWSEVDDSITKLSGPRRTDGSGCNVPSKSTGYYLGGRSTVEVNASATPQYFHSIVAFDMKKEVTSVTNVPDFIPIIGQSLVYMDVGDEGILIALGGKTEKDGVLNAVRVLPFVFEVLSD